LTRYQEQWAAENPLRAEEELRQFRSAETYMKRFILTGTPGSGKTSILRQLEREGFGVVEEAATDIIAVAQAQGTAEPWTHPSFIDEIARLQKQRERTSNFGFGVQFYDRSVVCTAALATYLGYPFSEFLTAELERIKQESVYQRRVFFIRNLGFMTSTDARRISFEESLRFEAIHEQTYQRLGFELAYVAAGSVADRVNSIRTALQLQEGLT
jgi:predicted ATPase